MTDAISVLLTFLGLCFALYTYRQWLSERKREDRYRIAKEYISAMDQARDVLEELELHFGSMCPAPGMVVEPQEVFAQRLLRTTDVWHQLYDAITALLKKRRELGFWDVLLSSRFEPDHDEFVGQLRSLAVITGTLNNQLGHYAGNMEAHMSEVIREKEMFDARLNTVVDIFDRRDGMGFEKVFIF